MQFLVLACLLMLPGILTAVSWAQGPGAPPWEEAKAAIEAWYKTEVPESKVEEIVPAEERKILDFGLSIRHYARVQVVGRDQLRDRDRVAVTFTLVAEKWEVRHVRIIGSESLPEMEPPAEADALRMFQEVWKKDKCEGYEITAVKLTRKPRFQREIAKDRTQARRWFIYALEISATGTGDFRISKEGASYLLRITNGLLWNPGEKTWSVDPRWVKCRGFSKVKKD